MPYDLEKLRKIVVRLREKLRIVGPKPGNFIICSVMSFVHKNVLDDWIHFSQFKLLFCIPVIKLQTFLGQDQILAILCGFYNFCHPFDDFSNFSVTFMDFPEGWRTFVVSANFCARFRVFFLNFTNLHFLLWDFFSLSHFAAHFSAISKFAQESFFVVSFLKQKNVLFTTYFVNLHIIIMEESCKLVKSPMLATHLGFYSFS